LQVIRQGFFWHAWWLETCIVQAKMRRSVSAQPVKKVDIPDSGIQPVLAELVDIASELADQKEDLIAKGVPFGTVNAMVDACKRRDNDRLNELRESALMASEQRYGVGAINEQQLDDYLERINELAHDLMNAKKMARGLELNMPAINLLTQVIRENPGDHGSRVLGDVVGYAKAYGVVLTGAESVQSSAANDGQNMKTSVLPDIAEPAEQSGGLYADYRLWVEAALGLLATVVALWLLV
jgi:hypothetical protein